MNKTSLHEFVQAIQACASEVGHAPSKREFTAWGKGPHHSSVIRHFKTWSAAIIAAGLTPNEETQKKKTSAPKLELVKDPDQVQEIIRETTQRKIIQLNKYKKILCIGDIHFPYVDQNALSMVYAIAEKEQPDIIVQVGDLFDCYAQSKFPKSLNIFTPQAEWDLARKMAIDFWKKIREMCPKAECFQILGNHDIRASLRIEEAAPAVAHLIKEPLRAAFTFEGVTTIHDPTEELFIENIMFVHGHYTSGISKHMEYARMNVVHGHTHKATIVYKPFWDQNRNQTMLWEMDVGYLGDPWSKALSYRSQKIHNWTVGVGIVDNYGPRWIPF